MNHPRLTPRLVILAAFLLAWAPVRFAAETKPDPPPLHNTAPAATETVDTSSQPSMPTLDLDAVREARERLRGGDPTLQPAYKQLLADADQALKAGPFTVMAKKRTPPSGDKHDYSSMAPYWWPDPASKNGLPYIRHDGRVNPERNDYDKNVLWDLEDAVDTLALTYYFSGEERYADRAAVLLRAWFLDPATRMNPNMNYAQFIPGLNEGRGAGIIDGRPFFRMAQYAALLEGSKAWTPQNQQGFKEWLRQYLRWVLESENGKDEATKENNHGSWYAVQTAGLALAVGEKETAKKILEGIEARIAKQIEPDGKQPEELVRTRAFHYSAMNLEALFSAALLGDRVGLNLWRFSTPDGRSLRRGLEFLLPFALRQKDWPYPMLRGWEQDPERIHFLLRVASRKYNDPACEKTIDALPGIDPTAARLNLLYPKPR